MMNIRRSIGKLFLAAVLLLFFSSPLFPKSAVFLSEGALGGGTVVRVMASDAVDINSADSKGCEIVKNVISNYYRKLAVMECPAKVAEELGLIEDRKVELLDAGANAVVGADRVHASGNTGVGIKIAMIDTGMDYAHPELAGSFAGGHNFYENNGDVTDTEGHGTLVAGVMIAKGLLPSEGPAPQFGAARGVAPGASIYVEKVFFISEEIAAIYWAIDGPDGIYGTPDDPGVSVITTSVGSIMGNPYPYAFCDHEIPAFTAAIKYAKEKNVPVVASAGNSPNYGVYLPACIGDTIAVGATDKKTDVLAPFSSRGYSIDIAAPGTGIYTTAVGGGYLSGVSGTSLSAPIVAGTIALIKKAHPEYNVDQVKQALRNSAVYKRNATETAASSRAFETGYGWGRLDAYAAINSPAIGKMHTVCSGNACLLVKGAGKDECSSSAECFCSDSDGGVNPDVAGVVQGMDGNAWAVKGDYCPSEAAVLEYYCTGKNIASTQIACGKGRACSSGKCVERLPNLVPDMAFYPMMVINETQTIAIGAANIGLGPAGASVMLYFEGNNSTYSEVPALPRNISIIFNASFTCKVEDTYYFNATVDAKKQVAESNENDNVYTFQIMCYGDSKKSMAKPSQKKNETLSLCPTKSIIYEACPTSDLTQEGWLDASGCRHRCRNSAEEIKANLTEEAAQKKKQDEKTSVIATPKKTPASEIAGNTGSDGGRAVESAAESSKPSQDPVSSTSPSSDAVGSATGDASDSITNAMVNWKGDSYAKVMILLGVYLEKLIPRDYSH